MSEAIQIPMNRSEHMYWAGEGYLGFINIPFILRFDSPVELDLIRQTLRDLVTAIPRLRAVVEPRGFGYGLRILPDDHVVDQLFDDALRVTAGVDPSSRDQLEHFHNEFINEGMSLERGLPWRARFIPHATQPALMFAVHHIVGDGRAMVLMMCAIMSRLNGTPIPAGKLDSPSMLPATMPLKSWHWPGSIARWWRNKQADAKAIEGLKIISLEQGRSERFTTTSVRYYEPPCSADTLKALAKQYRTTVNTLLTAILANTFLALEPDNDKAVAALRISVDLRRYFPKGTAPDIGNYVYSFRVLAHRQASMNDQINSLEAQVKAHIARFARRDYAPPLLVYELLHLMGRTLYSKLVMQAKRKGTLPKLTCHISTLGSAEFINPKDARVRLSELWPTTVSPTLLVGAVSLNAKQFLTFVHQNDQIPQEAITVLTAQLDAQILHLVAQMPAAASATAASAEAVSATA